MKMHAVLQYVMWPSTWCQLAHWEAWLLGQLVTHPSMHVQYVCVCMYVFLSHRSIRWLVMSGFKYSRVFESSSVGGSSYTFCWLSQCWKQTWRTETWLLALCKEFGLYKDESVAARYHWTPSTCARTHALHTRAHSYLSLICFVSFPINCLILPNLSTLLHFFFSKRNALWSILTALLAFIRCIWQEWLHCFSQINQKAPWKTASHSWTPTPLSSLLFWRLRDSGRDSGHWDT